MSIVKRLNWNYICVIILPMIKNNIINILLAKMKSKNTNLTKKSSISETNSNMNIETKFPTSVDFYYRLKHDPNIKTNGIKK